MGGLPRPELPPGAQRDLVDTLHALHHAAGWPSLRALAREAGCSHTTVSMVFSSPRLPSWGVLELVGEALDGDVGELRRLWLAATGPVAASEATTAIAGRRSELAVVRRHLESGSGLLLVVGEAGIGKSRLVETAAGQATDVLVALGECLPLSTQVPLLPVAEALRRLVEADGGQPFKEALADSPRYVVSALHRLLPELDDPVPAPPMLDGDWWPRLLSAVGTVLSALADARPTAVLLEDLHWADPATLDLVEHLVSRAPPLPMVITYRYGDPATSTETGERLSRIRRLREVTTLRLQPLTRDETAEQLVLLGVAMQPSDADRIHRRSGGLPLFVDHLARAPGTDVLPEPLADLLDRRLAGLAADEWVIVRALGIADRSLTAATLRAVTGLGPTALTAGLRALHGRHLTTAGDDDVRLQHPLLAEAVRRRLVAGEAADEHRRLALALAAAPDPSSAEVAEHWRRADEPAEELAWRIRAARDAGSRFAVAQEAQQWQRALVLFPDDAVVVGTPGLRKIDAYLASLDALEHVDWPAAAALADEALAAAAGSRGPAAAGVHRRAGVIRGKLGDPAAGLALVDRALDLLDAERYPAERARALLDRAYLLSGLDRLDEAGAAYRLAGDLAAGQDPATARAARVGQALSAAESGRVEEGLEVIRVVASDAGLDPGDLHVAVSHTHLLVTAGRGADEVVAAGRPGLDAAYAWGIDDFRTSVLQGNLSEALRHAGRVQEAALLIDPVTEEAPTPHRWPTHSERGLLDLLRGRSEAATTRLDAVAELFVMDLANRALCAQDAPTADLWCDRPQRAYDRLTATLKGLAGLQDQGADVAGLLVLAARAAADLTDAAAPAAVARLRTTLLRELGQLVAGAVGDPFATPNINANRRPLGATWAAETARLAGEPSLARWVAAAAAWDDLARPHDAAYCRWRGARTALAAGRASTAGELLRRAERDAREHLPLHARIRAASAPSQRSPLGV